jgi:hypothetical protein
MSTTTWAQLVAREPRLAAQAAKIEASRRAATCVIGRVMKVPITQIGCVIEERRIENSLRSAAA